MRLYNQSAPDPKRGDRLKTSRSEYFVLHARQIKTRDGKRKFKLIIVRTPFDSIVRAHLLRSAARRGGSVEFDFKWDARAPKKQRTQIW